MPEPISRNLLTGIAAAGIAAALAAMLLPGPASDATGIAAILSLGSMAVLAGHGWGAAVVATADMLLVGKVWPIVILSSTFADRSWLVGLAALLAALPGLFLFALTLPKTVELVVGSPRATFAHSTGLAFASAGSLAWLVAPIL